MISNVIVIEDELPARSELLRKLDLIDPTIFVVDQILSVAQGIERLPTLEADLIFCDIQLTDGLSFEIFDQVECTIPVVFTTAYDEYAIRAFEVNSIGYLLKPVNTSELKAVLEKQHRIVENYSVVLKNTVEDVSKKTNFIRNLLVQDGQKLKLINVEDVAYFFAEGKYLFLTTWEGKQHLTEFNLTQITELLNPTVFHQLNRKYIAHISAVKNLITLPKSRIQVVLEPLAKDEVVVSSDRSVAFKNWLKRTVD